MRRTVGVLSCVLLAVLFLQPMIPSVVGQVDDDAPTGESAGPGNPDSDANGIVDDSDNCRHAQNPDQADADADGVGDVCDGCPNVFDPEQRESEPAGTFDIRPRVITSLADGAESVFAADVDGDGDIDALSASSNDDTVAWYENLDGAGQFGSRRLITQVAKGASSVFAADVDGDGDTDALATSSLNDTIAWFENVDGAGAFGPERRISTAADGARSVVAADLDGDGDVDVLAASSLDDTIAWFENLDGAGTFGPERLISTTADGAASVAVADMNLDGDLDVLCASPLDDTIAWFENLDGAGTFGPERAISTTADGAQSVATGDVDRDGDPDVFAAFDSVVVWYRNRTGGTFDPPGIITGLGTTVVVAAADLDGDGDADALVASASLGLIVWVENRRPAATTWTLRTVTDSAPGVRAVFAADVDGDGDLDALSASAGDDRIAWFRNGGDGRGDVCDNCPGDWNPLQADADGDDSGDACDNCPVSSNPDQQDQDADGFGDACDNCPTYSSNSQADEDNDGVGNVCDPCTDTDGDGFGDPGFGASVCPPDLCPAVYDPVQLDSDGDGAPDACDVCPGLFDPDQGDPDGDGLGSRCGDGCPYDPNPDQADSDGDGAQDACDTCPVAADPSQADTEGPGAFGPLRPIVVPFDVRSRVTAADIDGDGDLDAIHSSPYWFENLDGAGTFGGRRYIPGFGGSYSVFAADLDSDGDVDLLTGLPENLTEWFENEDGHGTFATRPPIQAYPSRFSGAVFAADVDGDGDLDVLTAGVNGAAWNENVDGAGGFGPPRVIVSDSFNLTDVFAADVDGDGDLDVLVGKTFAGNGIRWYANVSGDGSVWEPRLITESQRASHVFAADIDGDGDLDVLTCSDQDETVMWYPSFYLPNFGFGFFGPGRPIASERDGAESVFAADMDLDGDLDAVASGFGFDTEWYENLDGAGTFGPGQVIGEGRARSAVPADFDGDGDPDLLTSEIAWYENGGDGVGVSCDNCPAVDNTDQADTDADGQGDACDTCPDDSVNDGDADGLCSDADNCPSVSNAGQADGDGDSVGDACDNCPSSANTGQADQDGDGRGDACDNCSAVANADQANHDSDALGDACDNCPDATNGDQTDQDGDGIGDACDACNDVDHDSVCAQDNCPSFPNPDQADQDGDGQGDACEPPVLSVVLTPDLLWPPNHRLVEVVPTITASAPSGAPAVSLVSVTSDEPDDAPGSGDGSTIGDVVIEADRFLLRAERLTGGDGRTYTVVYEATTTNGSQLTTQVSATVVVPRVVNGSVDPVTLSLARGPQGTIVSWPLVDGAEGYHAIRGDRRSIVERPQEIDLGAVVCLASTPGGAVDAAVPPPGVVYFYVVEYVDDGLASGYGTESVSKPREPSSGACGG